MFLNYKTRQRVVSLFNKKTKDARKIAETLDVPRRSVMEYLEYKELRRYSAGSYN
jgi:hypothetical protein